MIELIKAEGRIAVAVPGDIREEAFCKKMVADTVGGLGGLDILVNNAGQQVFRESILEISTEQLESTFKTNVFAMVWITKAALPHLKPGSVIICTTSYPGVRPLARHYRLRHDEGGERQLRQEPLETTPAEGHPRQWGSSRPRVDAAAAQRGPEHREAGEVRRRYSFGRPGQPAELAATFVLLASNDSSFVSGEIHGVTGGHPTA